MIAERLFDPWGQPIKVEDGAGKVLQGLTLLDRGYTGHEHLQTVGLIHMNGRLYDPALHRFLQPDNYVQDPFNTQNFNRYGYCLNNPLVYVDENGEFIITVLIVGAIIGAYIGGSQANGTYNPFKWDFNNVDTWIGMVGGAVVGGVSGGVAAYAGGLAAAGLAAYGITGGVIGGAVVGATSGLVGGAISGGFMSLLPGGNGKFWESAGWGALSGFVGGAILGGATGALTTPKGHNIWTGREIQPVQTLEGAPINIHLDAENNITGNLELNTPTTNSVLDLQQPKLIPIETPDGGIRLLRMGNTDINSLQGEVRNNFKRFISKIPANSKTNATWRVLDDGNYLFQTISPGKVPGSTALYQKIVSPQGETLKMIKTTFSPQGDIIHVKSKL
ncbi:RHS repeat-associated core domain-containing protein [Capnocytophaga leadbetteri]